jgi:hypothetical protein
VTFDVLDGRGSRKQTERDNDALKNVPIRGNSFVRIPLGAMESGKNLLN